MNCRQSVLMPRISFFFQAEDGIRDVAVTGVQTCALPILCAARSVAAFTADVPLRYLACPNVVIHRMAAVAGRTGRALHIVRRIKRLPPIGSLRNKVRAPDMMGDVPLGRLRIIVIANSRKVPLLPDAPINQRDLVLREFGERVAREIRKDGVRMFARITDHLGHRRFFPSIVNLVMAVGARLRTGVVRRSGGGLLLGLLSAGKRAKTAEDRKSVV